MKATSHPLAHAIEPLMDAIGGSLVATTDIEPALGVRLDEIVSLERLVATVEEQLGSPLAELDRTNKQRAVAMLDQRGAFRLRKSIEDIGEAMGVSRITIYNYLSSSKDGE